MVKVTNLTRKKHDKPSAKIDEDGRHFIWRHQLGSHSLETVCGINVVGGGGGSGGIAKQYGESIRICAIVSICHAYLAHT